MVLRVGGGGLMVIHDGVMVYPRRRTDAERHEDGEQRPAHDDPGVFCPHCDEMLMMRTKEG